MKHKKGNIYIFSNNKQDRIVKIGKTQKHPEIRANELSRQTAAVGKFKVEWFKEVEDASLLEKLLHFVLRHFHYDKEYFAVDIKFAIEIANKTIDSINSIENEAIVDFYDKIKNYERYARTYERLAERQKDEEKKKEYEIHAMTYKRLVERMKDKEMKKKY